LGRRPLGAVLHSSNEPGELSQWLCHDDSTINIGLDVIIICGCLPPTTEEVYVFVRTLEFVCLSVSVQDYSKTHAWIWMKCCMSTDFGTWKNWLTFEPDPDHNPDAGTGFLSPMACALQRGNVEFYYVGKIPCMYWYWGPVEAATRGFEA